MNENPSGPSPESHGPAPDNIHSIEMLVQLTQTPRHLIGVYCQQGLIAPVAPPETGGWQFDDDAIRELRRIERLRTEYSLELPALRLLMELWRETERLREEVRHLRAR